MYMYYLLGHKLMDLDISIERKTTIADNTYLLALDGDIDFTPDAVQMLVDLMKKSGRQSFVTILLAFIVVPRLRRLPSGKKSGISCNSCKIRYYYKRISMKTDRFQ